ncbi:MAG: glycogen/starch synthase [Patescibacteria group bacterium]|nr:glycogen/starch synthase [Patescibacteria group bacterium]
MKVLYCSSECDPFVKIGGLGDVSAALPKALSRLGVEVRVAIPFYDVIEREKFSFEKMGEIEVPFADETHKTAVWQTLLPGTDVMVLLFENDKYLFSGGTEAFTGLDGEIRRFAFFDRAVVSWLEQEQYWKPDVLHLNDWHTGLIPKYVEELEPSPAILLTVHNLSYQGISSLDLFSETGLSIENSRLLSWDAQDDNIDFLLVGIAKAHVINTVSPTYAKEILTSEFGEGLDEVLRSRKARIFGVLNGIDTESFDPEKDGKIFANYTIANWRDGKAKNKEGLQQAVGLEENPDKLLVGFVGRLDPDQKGLDLIYKAWRGLKSLDLQFVLLGIGDPEWEKKFQKLDKNHDNFSAQIKFDKQLARRIFAGADVILMPSKFEPCGLPQMMGMRYGAVPVVHAVGGLADTVQDGENGFAFSNYSKKGLIQSLKRALLSYKVFKGVAGADQSKLEEAVLDWGSLVEAGMGVDFSWSTSAKQYFKLYQKALGYRFGVERSRGAYREDAFTGEWRIVSEDGGGRLQESSLDTPESCPFGEGRENKTPPEVLRLGRGIPNGPGWEVRVVPNKFPVLSGHEVIIHSPDHYSDLAQLPLEHAEKIIQAYLFRCRHYDDKGLPFVFNNHGPNSGASLSHPHSQLVVFEKIPESIQEKLEKAEPYFRENKECPYCDLIKREQEGKRKVFENSHFLVIVPYAAEWPYEMLVLPKEHEPNFSKVDLNTVTALADVLKKTCDVMTMKFGNKVSYNYWIHSLSEYFLKKDRDGSFYFHWHLEFVPREKKLGGIELGAEIMAYGHGTPEQAAQELRNLFSS